MYRILLCLSLLLCHCTHPPIQRKAAACAGRAGLVWSYSDELRFDCRYPSGCGMREYPVNIRNCSGRLLRIERVEMKVTGLSKKPWYPRHIVWSYSAAAFARRQDWKLPATIATDATPKKIELTLHLLDGGKARVERRVIPRIEMVNRAQLRCQRCKGLWGPLGCNCKAKDAGKECLSSSECQGLCLHRGFHVMRRGRCGSPRPPLGFPTGRCSPYIRYTGRQRCYYPLSTFRGEQSLCRVPIKRVCLGSCVIRRSWFVHPLKHQPSRVTYNSTKPPPTPRGRTPKILR